MPPPLERLLVLGWNRRAPLILEQLSHYILPDSEVLVVAALDPAQMRAECADAGVVPVQVTFQAGNPTDRQVLEKLAAGQHQHVVILSPADAPDIQIADAATIVSLLHLREIARQGGYTFSIISEILDIQNRDLAEVTSADDVIISERLVALALTQMAENRDALAVFTELLNPGGAEVYLKPVQEYVVTGKPVSFYTVVEAARRKGQTALGYRLLAEAGEPDRAFGVHLNPHKAEAVAFFPGDRIVVLAED